MFQHVFGPVPSRRLGRSLGVDLVPFKTYTYDCIYCQLGRTKYKTAFREECKGPIWLEVLLLAGITALEAEVRKLARLIDRIKPDKVQLNTLSRPPAEDFALAVPPEKAR